MADPDHPTPAERQAGERRTSRFAAFALAFSMMPPIILALTIVWPIVLKPELGVGSVLGVLCPWTGALLMSALGVPIAAIALVRMRMKPELRGGAVGGTAFLATLGGVIVGLLPVAFTAVALVLAVILLIVGIAAAIAALGSVSVSGRPLGRPATRWTHHLRGRRAIWAARAHDEQRSVDAFLALARDLERLGAPGDLVRRARLAADDEARHAQIARDRAGGCGLPEPARPPEPLGHGEIARRAVLEGCLGEAFAAEVLRAEGEPGIADEEAGHAELAWDIVRWVGAPCVRLPPFGWMPSDRVGLVRQVGIWRRVRADVRRRLAGPALERDRSARPGY